MTAMHETPRTTRYVLMRLNCMHNARFVDLGEHPINVGATHAHNKAKNLLNDMELREYKLINRFVMQWRLSDWLGRTNSSQFRKRGPPSDQDQILSRHMFSDERECINHPILAM